MEKTDNELITSWQIGIATAVMSIKIIKRLINNNKKENKE